MFKHKLFKVVAIWLLLINTFAPFNLLFPVGGALKYAFFMGIALLLFPNLLTKRSMVILLIYTLETLVYFFTGNAYFDTINDVVIPFLSMGSSLILIEYVFEYDMDYKFSKTALLTSISATLLVSLISIPILNMYPEIIRETFSAGTKEDIEWNPISVWVISWGTVNGIVYLVAPMVFLCRKSFRKNRKMFNYWLFTLLVFYFIVFRSNITTPFILCTGMIIMGYMFAYEKFNQSVVIKIVLIGATLVLLTSTQILVSVIEVVQNNLEYGSTYQRLDEVKETLIYGEATGTDLESRNNLYDQSWQLFIESPLIGTSTPERISHHTYLLDRLACHGIIFIIPLLLIFYTHFRKVYGTLRHTKVTYMLGVSVFVFLLFYKGSSDANFLFSFFLLPVLCRYIDDAVENRLIKLG